MEFISHLLCAESGAIEMGGMLWLDDDLERHFPRRRQPKDLLHAQLLCLHPGRQAPLEAVQ
ncbi:hypothetical protein C4D60_Mb05t25850 [Musa balbisiana]|uniref:Uncharacterized protein n=1 Tax=Musa balbisiana TaxID=52838 RepID=A0A4S8JYV9_MUSBA|nr:hypothetical protein C4D60_Mb05t25850 [Musa balbisiana]